MHSNISLTDFADHAPEGTFISSGAYSGVFISNSTAKPFMGVAFKVRLL